MRERTREEKTRPPRITRALMTGLLRSPGGEHIVRDLDEAFERWILPERGARSARSWYRRQAWDSMLRLLVSAVSRSSVARAVRLRGWRGELRAGVRSLIRRPAFSATVIGTLALGVSAMTTVFSVVNGVLLRPLDLPEPDRLVAIWSWTQTGYGNSSGPNLVDLRREAEPLSEMYIFSQSEVVLDGEDGRRRNVSAVEVTWPFLHVLGVEPLLGRGLRPEDDQDGAAPVVMISHTFWTTHFGSDPEVVGRTVGMAGVPTRIVAVLPPGFEVPMLGPVDLVHPFGSPVTSLGRDLVWLGAVARLNENDSVAEAQSAAETVWEELRATYPDDLVNLGIRIVPLHSYLVHDVRRALILLLASTGLLLLLGCVNVGSLMLARGRSRMRELALRAALGAGRGGLVRHLLVEGALLTGAAVIVALAVTFLGTAWLRSAAPPDFPRIDAIEVDTSVLLFSLGVAVVVGIVTAVSPALRLTRSDPSRVSLRNPKGAPGGGSASRRALSLALQVALAGVLLSGGGLLVRSLSTLLSVDPGYRIHDVLTADIRFPGSAFATAEARASAYRTLEEAARALPGVEDAGLVLSSPMTEARINYDIAIDGLPPFPPEEGRVADLQIATGGLFSALEIPLRSGRLFASGDDRAAPRVALVNEALAEDFWPEESPLGHRIAIVLDRTAEPTWYEVIGVVANIKHQRLDDPVRPHLYFSAFQIPQNSAALMVRTGAVESGLSRALVDLVPETIPGAAVPTVRPLEAHLRDTISVSKFYTLLLSVFSALAVGLASVGVYGALSYRVLTRRRDIGVKIAIGAAPGRVLRGTIGEGMAPVLVGLGLGLAVAVAIAGQLESLLFEIRPHDPWTFAVVGGVLLAICFTACLLPAWHAASTDPVRTLQGES